MKNIFSFILLVGILFMVACSGDTAGKQENSTNLEKETKAVQKEKSAVTENNASVKKYETNWLSVEYPASFVARPSLLSDTTLEEGYSSVFFESPDKLVEFYVYSTALYIEPSDIALTDSEKLVSEKETKRAHDLVKTWTIAAKDKSYMRSYSAYYGEDGLIMIDIVGLKYKDTDAYNKYKDDYIAFKKSFLKANY